MGTSSSKSSSKRLGNNTREFLSASMSAGASVPEHMSGGSSAPPGQTERAPFINHPIYLPPLAQRQSKQSNQTQQRHVIGADQLVASWTLYSDGEPEARDFDREELLHSPTNAGHFRLNGGANHRLELAHLNSAVNKTEGRRIAPAARRYTQQERLRLQRNNQAAAAAAPPAPRFKGATTSGGRRLRAMGAADGVPRSDVVSVGGALSGLGAGHTRGAGTKAGAGGDGVGRRNRKQAARQRSQAQTPLAPPSSSLSRAESLGSRLDFCCCAECCAECDPAALEYCLCEGSGAGELGGRNDEGAAVASDFNDFYHRGADRDHDHEGAFATNLSTAAQKAPAKPRNTSLNLSTDHHNHLKHHNENENDNDETTTCSAESSSELANQQHPIYPLTPATSSSISSSSTTNPGNARTATNGHRALSERAKVNAKTTSTKQNIALDNYIMSTTAANHLHNNNCKHASNGHSNTTNATMAAAHKRPSLERGLAMDIESRQRNGLLGLLPPAVQDQQLQSKAVMNFLENCQDELSKYVYLRHLKDFNEKLFYYTLINNVQKLMPLVYTPTVGLACQKFSEIYLRPRGLFITANDAGRIRQIIANWPESDVRVIVVTDGERILGLGDLGANGMGISIGKLSLYTSLAGIPPQNVLPITIDVGTENETFLNDPFYIGLKQRRVRGEKYDALIEEFMQAVVERWGRSCLIQFEDFGNSTAFNLLKRYRKQYCTFNDDIQGTASVSLSGLISAAKLTGKRLIDCSYLFYGAGEANLGTAQLLVMAMVEDGLRPEEAKQHIWLVDSKGLVVTSRQDLSEHKREFARAAEPLKDLEAIIDFTKPTAIVGASAQGGSFNESICRKMASYNEQPIIFALSNPTSKAECTADQAYRWTDGKCVFASGSPFEPVQYKGKTYVTGQGNNAYIFPAVGLAAIGAHTHTIPEEAFLVAARALSEQVTPADSQVGLVYPTLTKIREVTLKVATRVLEHLFAERLATYRPEPSDKTEFLRAIQYNPSY